MAARKGSALPSTSSGLVAKKKTFLFHVTSDKVAFDERDDGAFVAAYSRCAVPVEAEEEARENYNGANQADACRIPPFVSPILRVLNPCSRGFHDFQ